MTTRTDSGPDHFALIIGAMKSGTTSLFEVLAQHPQIAAASVKEPGYFVGQEAWNRGWDWYSGLWDWDPARHRVALEASTAYTTFPVRPGVPSRIAEVPGATFRFIYIMRNPLSQIASNVRHTLYVGWGRPLDDGVPAWMVDTVRYAMQIEQYLAIFPRESVFLVTLEEFQTRPAEVLARLCRFLEIEPTFAFRNAEEKYNKGDAYELPAGLARLLKAGPLRWLALNLVSRGWRHRLRALLPRLTRRRAALGRYQLTEREQHQVLEELMPDLRRLEATHGVEVGRYWGIETGTSKSLVAPPGGAARQL